MYQRQASAAYFGFPNRNRVFPGPTENTNLVVVVPRDNVYPNANGNRSTYSARSTETFLRSLMDEGKTQTDPEGIHNVIDTVFQYVASNTKYFSEKTFSDNLEELCDHLTDIHNKSLEKWKKEMFVAVQNQNLNMIKKLLRVNGFDINSEIGPVVKDEEGRDPPKHTALTWATWQGNLNMVKHLSEEGAKPGVLTSEDMSALNFAAMKESNLHILQYLLEQQIFKISPNRCGKTKKITPLISASSFGSYECVKYLLSKGANVNHQDSKGFTAMHHATIRGDFEVIKLLGENDACTYLGDNEFKTVLHHLILNVQQFKDDDLMKCLKYFVEDKGLSVTHATLEGSTALHEACTLGLFEIAKFLMDHGANTEAKKQGWETPLWSLVMGNCAEKNARKIILLMMEKGANFEVKNVVGLSLTDYATQISKNMMMTTSLEEALKIIRVKRMKELIAKRRQILTSSIFGNLGIPAAKPEVIRPIQLTSSLSTSKEEKISGCDIENKKLTYNVKDFDLEDLFNDDNSSPSPCSIKSDLGDLSDLSSSSTSDDEHPQERKEEQKEMEIDKTTSQAGTTSGVVGNPNLTELPTTDSISDSDDDVITLNSPKKQDTLTQSAIVKSNSGYNDNYEDISSATDSDMDEGNGKTNGNYVASTLNNNDNCDRMNSNHDHKFKRPFKKRTSAHAHEKNDFTTQPHRPKREKFDNTSFCDPSDSD